MKKTPTKRFRSPLAKARDAWMESPEFANLSNPVTLGSTENMRPYLSNRLERAFLAGVKVGENLSLRVNRKS